MKTRFAIVVGLGALVILGAFLSTRNRNMVTGIPLPEKTPLGVHAERISERETVHLDFSSAGSIGYESEAILTAQVAGTIVTAPIQVNQRVATGQLLYKIDETGNSIPSLAGFQSADIQQAQLRLKNAEKEYSEARHNDERDDTTASKITKDQARNDRDIASLSYKALLDKRLVKSPTAGIITVKNGNLNDTVTVGTPLAIVSNGRKIIRFYASDNERPLIAPGQTISFSQDIAGTERFSGTVLRVSQNADVTTRRFLVEAESSDPQFHDLPAGSIVTIFTTLKKTARPGNFFLPLSAVLREQNGSAIFVLEGNTAKRVPVTIVTIIGETVELTDIDDRENRVVMTNVKQIKDGDTLILE